MVKGGKQRQQQRQRRQHESILTLYKLRHKEMKTEIEMEIKREMETTAIGKDVFTKWHGQKDRDKAVDKEGDKDDTNNREKEREREREKERKRERQYAHEYETLGVVFYLLSVQFISLNESIISII